MSETERRKEVRHRINRMIGAELAYPEQTMQVRLFVLDISWSGFRATCPEPLPESTDLPARLRLASREEPVEARIAIRWNRQLPASGLNEMGFEFLELGEEGWQRLKEFIRVELEKARQQPPLDLSSPWNFGQVEKHY